MKRLKLEIEFEYDDELMHGNVPEDVKWFMDEVLKGSNLTLHDSDIGDTVGKVRVVKIEEES